MSTGEWLTRGTIWLALALYVASEAAGGSNVSARRARTARWLFTWGAVAFFIHVTCAFQFYHSWSHTAAYAETARQTHAMTGGNSGVGLYVNYLFGAVWLGEALWIWGNPSTWKSRANWITWCLRGFFLFMMVNGAVIFVRGHMRWLGLALSVALVACWWKQK